MVQMDLTQLRISNFDYIDIIATVAFCALFTIGFMIWRQFFLDSRKKQAWFMMLTASFVLSIAGIYYVILGETQNLWTLDYVYGDDRPSRLILLFFLASNIVDLGVGVIYYPEHLHPLTTVFHHFFYMAIIIGLLELKVARGFCFVLPMEIPTFMLSLGTIWSHLRTDLAFGFVFFSIRIVYHLIVVYRLAMLSIEGTVWKLCFSSFPLHAYWFYKWTIGTIKRFRAEAKEGKKEI